MDDISKKITSRPGFSKAILVMRIKMFLKKSRGLFNDNGIRHF